MTEGAARWSRRSLAVREVSVLILPASDVRGQWVAHCLNWDLVSQGDSPSHAATMITEAVVMAIEEDTKAGLDPADRPSAPQPLWDLFVRTQHGGTRIAPGDVDRLAASAHTKDLVIAAVMYIEPTSASARPPQARRVAPPTPPPLMIAAFQDHSRSAVG